MPSGSIAAGGFSSKARKSKISFSKQGFPGELSEPHLFRPPVSLAGGAAPISATERNAGRRSLTVGASIAGMALAKAGSISAQVGACGFHGCARHVYTRDVQETRPQTQS
jgi:hypothetical protein